MEYTEEHVQPTNATEAPAVEMPVQSEKPGKAPKHILHTKKLDHLFAHSREVVMYVANDERSTVDAISDSISAFGYTAAEFTSGERSLRDIIQPDDLHAVTGHVNEQLGRGTKSFDLDFRIIGKPDDRPVWVTCVVLPEYDPTGKVTHFLVKLKDISRQVETEQRLIAEKNSLQVMGDYFPNGCLFRMKVDHEAKKVKFSYLSKTWEKMTNTGIGDSMQNIDIPFAKMHRDDLRQLMSSIWSPPGLLDDFDSELRYFYTENEMRWFQISTHKHRENGQTLLDGFIFDITDRKRAEAAFGLYQDDLERSIKERTRELEAANRELYDTNLELLISYKELEKYQTQLEEMVASKTVELMHAKEKAEESDQLKSAFLANMSHEIRTPLNGIIGFLNFLTSDTLSPGRREEYVNVIRNNSTQLVKLIDDIIDLAKIEARQMSISPVPFLVNDLMNELQVFFETYLQSSRKDNVAVILDDSGFIHPCTTFVDPMRLRQALINLISNAIKFTEKGYVRFGYSLPDPHTLEFVVEDTGIGLAPDRMGVIFERFRQAETTTNHHYGGTGLGLTISRSLVQLMGGDIRVESVEGAGSTFYFTIPYIPVASADEHLFEETGKGGLPDKIFADKVVLVVEQGVMKSRYYEKLLSAMGLSVILASSMQQWFDSVGKINRLDAVIAGISILNNADTKIYNRVKSARPGLPAIILTPGQVGKYRQLIHNSQCNLVLEEPLHYHDLLKAVSGYIRPASGTTTALQKLSAR